jgi:hypothetical protein
MIIFVRKKLQLCRDGGACPPGSGHILIVGLLAGQYLSQWTRYRQIPVCSQEAAKSLRDLASPDLEKVYINLDSRKTRGETMKKSESEMKVIVKVVNDMLRSHISSLERRLVDLEAEVEALQRGDNTGFKHENDGGYFD